MRSARRSMFFALLLTLICVGCASPTMIRSTPPGATVSVDGVEIGETPLSYRFSSINEHAELTFELTGYRTKSQVVRRIGGGLPGHGSGTWPDEVHVQLRLAR